MSDTLTKMRMVLVDLGFKDVCGMLECRGGVLEGCTLDNILKPKEQFAFRFDTNNGVCVIYDELGHAWINRSYRLLEVALCQIRVMAHIERGAYVPFSNDGGYMAVILFPEERDFDTPTVV